MTGSPPESIAAPERLAADVRLLTGRLTRRLRAQFPLEVTPSQLSALATLSEHGPIHLRDLAEREGVTAPTASRVATWLIDHGYVCRTPDPLDARCALLALTDSGRRSLDSWRQARSAALAERLAGFSDAERDALAAAVPVLRRLVDELGTLPGGRVRRTDGTAPVI